MIYNDKIVLELYALGDTSINDDNNSNNLGGMQTNTPTSTHLTPPTWKWQGIFGYLLFYYCDSRKNPTRLKPSKMGRISYASPLVDVVEHTTVSIGYGCLILQIDLL